MERGSHSRVPLAQGTRGFLRTPEEVKLAQKREGGGNRTSGNRMASLGQALGFSVMTLFILPSGRGSSFLLELGK